MSQAERLDVVEQNGVKVVEGRPEESLVTNADEARCIIEACVAAGADTAVLYAENLPGAFFDLSSGVAGAILQKLRNYRVRLAVVCVPGRVTLSKRFGEMLAEERQGREFALFESRAAALAWVQRP
jgi:hypothetical protein